MTIMIDAPVIVEGRPDTTKARHTMQVAVGETISWDSTNPIEVDAAREQFDKLNRSHVMYRIGDDRQPEALQAFDPNADVLAVPPLQGG